MKHRFEGALAAAALVVGVACSSGGTTGSARPPSTTSAPAPADASSYVSSSIPDSPVGIQLRWFLEAARSLPIPVPVLQQHFSAAFLSQLSPDQLNATLTEGGDPSAVRFLGVLSMEPALIDAEVDLGAPRGHVVVSMSVDAAGGIAGLLFKPPPLGSRAARRLAPVSLPEPTGPRPVGTETFVTADSGRDGRKIPVQVWYPAAGGGAKRSAASTYALPATSALLAQQFGVPLQDLQAIRTNATTKPDVARPSGRLPVVLFSPGLGVGRPLYSGLGAELASHGYVVAVMDHPGDGQLVEFPDGTTVPGLPPANEEALTALLATRVADAEAVLDLLEQLDGRSGGRLSKALDLDHVAFVGHSFGGATAAEAMRLDRRFLAGVNLDGTMYGAVLQTGLDRPFLLVSSDHPQGEDDESWTAFRGQTAQARQMLIAGSAHMSFTDQPALSSFRPAGEPRDPAQLGTIDPARSFAVQSTYVLAFLDQQLRGTRQPLLDGPSATYPEVHFG